jgi:hypothetical protein
MPNYVLPKPIYEAVCYSQIIDWNKAQVQEPPLTLDLTDKELLGFVDTPYVLGVKAHSQPVERLVQTITKIGKRAASEADRDGLTRATLRNRERLPRCRTKADFANL